MFCILRRWRSGPCSPVDDSSRHPWEAPVVMGEDVIDLAAHRPTCRRFESFRHEFVASAEPTRETVLVPTRAVMKAAEETVYEWHVPMVARVIDEGQSNTNEVRETREVDLVMRPDMDAQIADEAHVSLPRLG